MMFFDTHAHYDDARFDEDREALLSSLKENGVSGILVPGTSLSSSLTCVKYANTYDFIWAAVGVHPSDAHKVRPGDMEALEELAKSEKKVKAIGEIGLEYFYDDVPKLVQKDILYKQLEIAKRVDLPVIIHDRQAHADIYDALKNADLRGVIHCYSGSAEMAREYVKMGYMISFTGAITFKNAKKSAEVIQTVPMEHIMIETDSPYLSPEPYRGKRNDSSKLPFIAAKIAQVKGIALEDVARITEENARRFFSL